MVRTLLPPKEPAPESKKKWKVVAADVVGNRENQPSPPTQKTKEQAAPQKESPSWEFRGKRSYKA